MTAEDLPATERLVLELVPTETEHIRAALANQIDALFPYVDGPELERRRALDAVLARLEVRTARDVSCDSCGYPETYTAWDGITRDHDVLVDFDKGAHAVGCSRCHFRVPVTTPKD